jgi:hypothetical protein
MGTGVLQGGILSPENFDRYVDDLPIKLRQYVLLALLYADDFVAIINTDKELR